MRRNSFSLSFIFRTRRLGVQRRGADHNGDSWSKANWRIVSLHHWLRHLFFFFYPSLHYGVLLSFILWNTMKMKRTYSRQQDKLLGEESPSWIWKLTVRGVDDDGYLAPGDGVKEVGAGEEVGGEG